MVTDHHLHHPASSDARPVIIQFDWHSKTSVGKRKQIEMSSELIEKSKFL